MTDESPDRDKLEALATRIREAQDKADPARHQKAGSGWGMDRGAVRAARIASDFVATVMVPMVVGGFVDRQLGTEPLLTVGLLFVGFIVGFYRLVHALDSRKKEGPTEQDRPDKKD